MNNQFFSKDKLKGAVNDYLELDNQILTLQKAIKERKEKKDKLSKVILNVMKDNEIDQMNLKNDKLVYTVSQCKSPLNKNYLNSVLSDYFNNNEKTVDVINHILNNRQKVERIRLKRVIDKKKKCNVIDINYFLIIYYILNE